MGKVRYKVLLSSHEKAPEVPRLTFPNGKEVSDSLQVACNSLLLLFAWTVSILSKVTKKKADYRHLENDLTECMTARYCIVLPGKYCLALLMRGAGLEKDE